MEAICFALGIGSEQLRSQSLQGLVHHARGAQGSCAVALSFTSDDDEPSHRLSLQRRVIGGKKSEFSLQECRCVGSDPSPPWACNTCAVRTNVRRSALRDICMRVLLLDIDSPERFVVQQAGVLAVAQRSPVELLRLLELLVGTDQLRARIEEQLTLAAQLRSQIEGAEAGLSSERLQMGRHVKSFNAFQILEKSRVELEKMKARSAFLFACPRASPPARPPQPTPAHQPVRPPQPTNPSTHPSPPTRLVIPPANSPANPPTYPQAFFACRPPRPGYAVTATRSPPPPAVCYRWRSCDGSYPSIWRTMCASSRRRGRMVPSSRGRSSNSRQPGWR